MKIRLAILENDQGFLTRITNVFGVKYADRLEIIAGTSEEEILNYIHTNKVDVFLVSDFFEIDPTEIPSRTQMAYLTDAADTEVIRDCRAVFKYQKADFLFKQILSIGAEGSGLKARKNSTDQSTVILFTSPCGGTGTTTAAVACARRLSAQGEKVLYLDYSVFGDTALFFGAQGPFSMSDVIYGFQKKSNLAMKLESFVRKEEDGVFFFASPAAAPDMMELSFSDKAELLEELCSLGSYSYIVLDADFSLEEGARSLMRLAQGIVLVSDGSESANRKILRAYGAMQMLEEDAASPIPARICLMYNRFSSKYGREITDTDIRCIGGAGRCDYQNTDQLLTFLAAKDLFDGILQ